MNDWASLFRSLTADTFDTVDTLDGATTESVQSVKTVQSVNVSKEKNETAATALSPILAAFSILERQCPDLVSVADWHHAVEDGRRFIAQWAEQAERLCWTEADLFGLHDPPPDPDPRYRRLSRYDAAGLIWCLRGRPVVAITERTAVIGTKTGTMTFYRRPMTHDAGR